jgi:hypothetical protein
VIAMGCRNGAGRTHHARSRPPHGASGPADLGVLGRPDILCLVATDLQMRQAEAVATHAGLHKRTARARVEAHLARMLAFDFEPEGEGVAPRLHCPELVLDA